MGGELFRHVDARNMYDERRSSGALLDFVNTGNRLWIKRVATESVDSLSRENDDAATLDDSGGAGNLSWVGHLSRACRLWCRWRFCRFF